MERIVNKEVHRLVVVDNENRVQGVISLSDILTYIVLKQEEATSQLIANKTATMTTAFGQARLSSNLETIVSSPSDSNNGLAYQIKAINPERAASLPLATVENAIFEDDPMEA